MRKGILAPRPVATLEVTVEYAELPDRLIREAINEALSDLNGFGTVTRASLTIPQPIVLDLTRDLF